MKQLDGTGLKRLHREWRKRTEGRVAVLLDSVAGPYNVGAIVRTAAAYRVEHLWLAGTTAPLASASARKTALGTDRYLQVATFERSIDAVHAARAAGYVIVAVELAAGAVPLPEAALAQDVCLVFGHEDHGVSAAVLQDADTVAYLPQLGRVGSLNVASAAAIAIYEVRRRQWAPGAKKEAP